MRCAAELVAELRYRRTPAGYRPQRRQAGLEEAARTARARAQISGVPATQEARWPNGLAKRRLPLSASGRASGHLRPQHHFSGLGHRLPLLLEALPALFRRDGVEQEPPGDVEDILDATEDAALLLILHVDGLDLNCHFFTVDEIELDLDPQEGNDEKLFAAVTNFLLLGRLLGRRVILTAEDTQDAIILEYSSVDDDIRHYPLQPS